MSDKLGALGTWGAFLGVTYAIARPAIPFILYTIAICVVLAVIVQAATKTPPRH
jgi:hypothetical protein